MKKRLVGAALASVLVVVAVGGFSLENANASALPAANPPVTITAIGLNSTASQTTAVATAVLQCTNLAPTQVQVRATAWIEYSNGTSTTRYSIGGNATAFTNNTTNNATVNVKSFPVAIPAGWRAFAHGRCTYRSNGQAASKYVDDVSAWYQTQVAMVPVPATN